jgi:hypothetical protein
MPEKANYIKEAVREPVNLWSLFLCAAASVYAATVGYGDLAWVPLAAGAAGEALYLMTLPATSTYRRLVEMRFRRRELTDRNRKREELVKTFDPREREAIEYLRWQKNQIYQNYQKFARMNTVPDSIRSLDTMWEAFVDLLDIYRRRKNHLRTINRQMIQNQIQQTTRSIESAPDDDTKRLHQDTLEILNKRLRTCDDIEKSIKRVEAQLQTIESFFGLVNDQVITMPTPEHISSIDFDSLLSSIQVTKEILEETAPIMNQLDAAERATSSAIRPPIAQRQ